MTIARYLILVGIFICSSYVTVSYAMKTFVLSPKEETSKDSGTDMTSRLESFIAGGGIIPMRIEVPSLGINASVQKVGISARGNMAVPTNYSEVGWYRNGPLPGAVGSAVVAGHYDNGAGLPAVFSRINDLNPGDEIIVRDSQGEELIFVVDRIANYEYKNAPLELIFNRADGRWLNLITCSGDWVDGEESYDRRTVVFAKLKI